jgi:hypothetical protein
MYSRFVPTRYVAPTNPLFRVHHSPPARDVASTLRPEALIRPNRSPLAHSGQMHLVGHSFRSDLPPRRDHQRDRFARRAGQGEATPRWRGGIFPSRKVQQIEPLALQDCAVQGVLKVEARGIEPQGSRYSAHSGALSARKTKACRVIKVRASHGGAPCKVQIGYATRRGEFCAPDGSRPAASRHSPASSRMT